jgi:hypothetical protein
MGGELSLRQKGWKLPFQHCRPHCWKEAGCSQYVISRSDGEQVMGVQFIELVTLLAGHYGDIPVQTALEHACAEREHLLKQGLLGMVV